ncbi:MAG: histidine kinase [Alteromonadaceae bacterium]|nr:histidine kinase [Alteromonadaceae bacterium]
MPNKFSLSVYYWKCQLFGMGILWLLLFAAGSISVKYSGDETMLRLVVKHTLFIIILFHASHLLRYWCKKQHWLDFNVKGFWQRASAACLLIGLLLTLVYWPFDLIVDFYLPPPENRSQTFIDMENAVSFRLIVGAIKDAVILIIWMLIYWAVHIGYNNTQIKLTNQALIIEQKNAELSNLRDQLNPHFLFNSLNNIRAMIHINSDKASDMVSELAELLRYSLQHSTELVSLEQELNIVECFLNLEKVRLADKLTIEQDISKDTLQCLLPPIIVQNLVENAVKHGISARRAGGLLTITSQYQPQGLLMTITNDGNLQEGISGLGVGLKNCRQRLKLLYGEQAYITLEQQNEKVITCVFIPHLTLKESHE